MIVLWVFGYVLVAMAVFGYFVYDERNCREDDKKKGLIFLFGIFWPLVFLAIILLSIVIIIEKSFSFISTFLYDNIEKLFKKKGIK